MACWVSPLRASTPILACTGACRRRWDEPALHQSSATNGQPETESSVLKGQLTKLGPHSMAARFEAEADRAAKGETSFTAYLGRLVELELADKADWSINARIARARFPVLRTLEQFDFSFQPSLSAARVRELASLTFPDQATNVLFVGGPGVGEKRISPSHWRCM